MKNIIEKVKIYFVVFNFLFLIPGLSFGTSQISEDGYKGIGWGTSIDVVSQKKPNATENGEDERNADFGGQYQDEYASFTDLLIGASYVENSVSPDFKAIDTSHIPESFRTLSVGDVNYIFYKRKLAMVMFSVDSANYDKYRTAISEKYDFVETVDKSVGSTSNFGVNFDIKADKFSKGKTEVYLMSDGNSVEVLYLSSVYKKMVGDDISKNINKEKEGGEKAKEDETKKDLNNIQ